MIFVTRDDGNKPVGFEERRRARDADLLAELGRDPDLTVPRHWSSVRRGLTEDAAALFRVFKGKCAFCESKMAHVARAHIEHYRPKGRPEFSTLVFRWDNWLLACPRCNEAKWAHFPDCDGEPCLLDPTTDRPDEHVDFVDEQISGISLRGAVTIGMIGLDRSPLADERAVWLTLVRVLLTLCLVNEARDEARQMLFWAMQDDAPYTMMTRRYIELVAPKLALRAGVEPRVSIDAPKDRIRELIERHSAALTDLS